MKFYVNKSNIQLACIYAERHNTTRHDTRPLLFHRDTIHWYFSKSNGKLAYHTQISILSILFICMEYVDGNVRTINVFTCLQIYWPFRCVTISTNPIPFQHFSYANKNPLSIHWFVVLCCVSSIDHNFIGSIFIALFLLPFPIQTKQKFIFNEHCAVARLCQFQILLFTSLILFHRLQNVWVLYQFFFISLSLSLSSFHRIGIVYVYCCYEDLLCFCCWFDVLLLNSSFHFNSIENNKQ